MEQKQEECQRATVKKSTVVVGRQREETTPVSFEIHVIGMAIAALYLAAYRREAYGRFAKDFKGIWRWCLGIVKP